MPEPPIWDGPGKPYYTAWRAAHNASPAYGKMGYTAPSWKKLKPKTMKVWNDAAINMREIAS